jgi:hypothetical protein
MEEIIGQLGVTLGEHIAKRYFECPVCAERDQPVEASDGGIVAEADQAEKFRNSKVCVHPEPPLKEPESIAVPRTIPAIDALPPAPPPPAATATPDVDARGIPWDGRIHAGNKATTKVGDWKRRRGVSVEEVQRIEAELVSPAPTTSTVSNPSSTAHTMQAPPPPPAPAELPGTEPPPATLDQVSHEAAKRNLGINVLNALAAEVTNGQVGQVALLRDKPAYIQMLHDRVCQYPLATS